MRQGVRRAVLGAATAAALATRAGAQDLTQRFSITTVQDTTFTFAVGRTRWVKPKQRGVAVDARARDMLVARFRVMRVDNGVATALITGETTRLAPVHTVVMDRPPDRWYRRPIFWAGLVSGLVVGVFGGASL